MLYSQRKQNVLREITFRTIPLLMQIVVFSDSVKSWNRIGFDVREIISLNVFKKKSVGSYVPNSNLFLEFMAQ